MGDSKLLRVRFAVNTHAGSNGSCWSLGRRPGRLEGGSAGAVGQQAPLGSPVLPAAFGSAQVL